MEGNSDLIWHSKKDVLGVGLLGDPISALPVVIVVKACISSQLLDSQQSLDTFLARDMLVLSQYRCSCTNAFTQRLQAV